MAEQQTVSLSKDEIRTALIIVDQYKKAQAKQEMAAEQQEEFIEMLRKKYQLDDSWAITDILDGFVKQGGNDGN